MAKRRYKVLGIFVTVLAISGVVAHQWWRYYTPKDLAGNAIKVPGEDQHFLRMTHRLWQDSEAAMVKSMALYYVGLYEPQQMADNFPGSSALDDLLDFEKRNRGKPLGLMSLRQILAFTGRSGLPDPTMEKARQEAARRLVHYVSMPETAVTFAYMGNGYIEPKLRSALLAIIDDDESIPQVRAAAQIALIDLYETFDLFMRNKKVSETALKRLESKTDPESVLDRMSLQWNVDHLPSPDQHEEWMRHADDLRSDVMANARNIRVVQIKPVDRDYYIVSIDEAATESSGSYAVKVPDQKFRPGQRVTDFSLSLVNRQDWQLSDQRGKYVVVQFSFTGCAPCKEMYQEIKAFHKKFPELVEFVTVMKDDTLQVTQNSVASEQLSWAVAFDENGAMCDDWGVRSYPTVFVIDPEGNFVQQSLPTARQVESWGNSL